MFTKGKVACPLHPIDENTCHFGHLHFFVDKNIYPVIVSSVTASSDCLRPIEATHGTWGVDETQGRYLSDTDRSIGRLSFDPQFLDPTWSQKGTKPLVSPKELCFIS